MNKIKSLLQYAPLTNRLTYLSAHQIADLFYSQVLTSYEIANSEDLKRCVIFCCAHLSTAVNLSICNYWISIFENIYLIPKKASLNTSLLCHVANPTRILQARERSDFNRTIGEIKAILSTSDFPVIIFDIGGYFAPYVDEISELLGDRLRLVIEDTANGHVKYESTAYFATSASFKSVAYDSYKMAENVMVASIILGHLRSFIPDWSSYKSSLVIGYGRIGRSLCFGLRSRGVKNLVVVESDKARAFMAMAEGFETLAPSQLSQKVSRFDYCFSMSGRHGVTPVVLSALKNNSYISVVTSYDDEFEKSIKDLFELGGREALRWEGKTLNVVNRGRPINLSRFAAFDARNLSLHFLFGRIFASFLRSLGFEQVSDWEKRAYIDIINEIQS
ncbi:NAD-binding protein [Pseudomonas fulva]|uniref:NAD-binding protein n=1 Tax=Pseudomonas fulva TaxID=47880 RepID=UPI000D9E9851|nr:NAD-binding protein [Pseudomonas fulva]PYB84552.1 hypothetical protein DMX01_21095 [Pseudomonas fulva]PYC09504.1 hypothetical protein DMX00_21155 [Pseudomonas fulva]